METHNSDTIIVDISFVVELLLDLRVFTSRSVILTSEMSNDNKSARSGGRSWALFGEVEKALRRANSKWERTDRDSWGAYWTPPGWREVRLTVSETISFLKG